MSRKAAITVFRPREGVQRLWESSEYRPDYIDAKDAAVTFVDAPGDRGTEIHVEIERARRRASSARWSQKLTGREPRAKVKDDLRRFKQHVETGVIARSEGAPEGELAERKLKQRPAQPLERVRASRRRVSDARERLVGPQHGPGRERPGPEDPQRARRDREDHLDGDLRVGPAPLRRLHPDDEEGRHPRPRVHGRDRRDRQEVRRTCRSATGWSCRSRSPAATAGRASTSCTRCARTRTRTPGSPRRCSATRPRASSATRTSPAATPAARRSTRGCPTPTSGRSRSRTT